MTAKTYEDAYDALREFSYAVRKARQAGVFRHLYRHNAKELQEDIDEASDRVAKEFGEIQEQKP